VICANDRIRIPNYININRIRSQLLALLIATVDSMSIVADRAIVIFFGWFFYYDVHSILVLNRASILILRNRLPIYEFNVRHHLY